MESELLDIIKKGFNLRSDAALAARLGISRTAISSVRTGKCRLSIVQRLKVLDKIAFLNVRNWVERVSTENISESLRNYSNQQAGRIAARRLIANHNSNLDEDLIDLLKESFDFKTDAELAKFLNVGANSLSMVRTRKGKLGLKPRLRILNKLEPFDLERMESALESRTSLIREIEQSSEDDLKETNHAVREGNR